MHGITRDKLIYVGKRTLIYSTAMIVAVSAAATLLWRDRPSLESVDWPPYPDFAEDSRGVTATWLGVTTILIDDGETQILIDGFFSRPSLTDIVFRVPVQHNAAQINAVLADYEMRRLAAIIPVHSHFDHVMDVGAIANRTSASVLGSETTVQIVRGAGVPDDQIMLIASGAEYRFGDFTVRLIESNHAPIGWGGAVPFAGTVDAPLQTPAPVSAWREGQSYSIVIAHAQGTVLIQGSAGFRNGALYDVRADVAMLGVWGLDGLGRDYTEQFWQALVTVTGATRVLPIHFEDYTRPFGEIRLSPRILDNFVKTAGWLDDIRQTWDQDTDLHLPEFGKPIVLYAPISPDA